MAADLVSGMPGSLDGFSLRCAITGASGFIGTRLAEILYLRFGIVARSIIRSYNKAARLARIEHALHVADMANRPQLDAAIGDADVVFHTAYEPFARENNVAGLENVADICMRRNIRLVYLGSFASYGPAQDGDLTEARRVEPCGFPYADLKLALEQRVLDLCRERNLNGIVLQPTIVYGPFGGAWTDVPVEQLLSSVVVLPRNGQGYCNVVYVDDVCQAMVRAADPRGPRGRKYIISSRAPVTWSEFYEALQQPLGTDSIALVPDPGSNGAGPPRRPELRQLLLAAPRWLLSNQTVKGQLHKMVSRMSPEQKDVLRSLYTRVAGRERIVPDSPYRVALFSARCHARIDAAAADLGYRPEFDFARGMSLTQDYIRWAYCTRHHAG